MKGQFFFVQESNKRKEESILPVHKLRCKFHEIKSFEKTQGGRCLQPKKRDLPSEMFEAPHKIFQNVQR